MAENRKRRIVFLCSGGGGNLALVHTALQRSWISQMEIAGVLTDRPCPANQIAERFGLYNKALQINAQDQTELKAELEKLSPDLIITTFHKILRPEIVTGFQDKLINLHYSLLPSFAGSIGTRPVKGALEYGSLMSGVTVHSVTEDLDAGSPLCQVAIPIHRDESVESLMPIFFRCGGIALLKAITSRLSQDFQSNPQCRTVLGRICLFNGQSSDLPGIEEQESFWQEVQQSAQA